MPRKKAPAKRKAPAGKKAPAKKRGRRNANMISVDFTDVDAGGMMPTPDGIYTAEVKSAEKDVSSNGNEMVVVRYKTQIGSTVFDRFMLLPQSLWVLRTALNCMGYETPDGQFDFDPDDLVGQTLGIEITNEEYEEKDQPRVTGYLTYDAAEEQAELPATEEEEEEEEEEPAPKKRRARKAAVEEEEEEEEEEPEEEEEEEEEEPPPKKAPRKKKAPAKKKGALRPGARVTFEDEDDEYGGVIESIEDGVATVVDDEDGEWEIPVEELTKA